MGPVFPGWGPNQLTMKANRKLCFAAAVLMAVAGTVPAMIARSYAHKLLTNPLLEREVPKVTPAHFKLPFTELLITNQGGLRLAGWYVPSSNRAAIMAQHGYKKCRQEMLPAAALLHRHGYGVLLTSVRAHDQSEGEQISFGLREMEDLEAWHTYLRTRNDVDPDRIGALGNSMGASLVIQFAATNAHIKAVVADSPFSSLRETVSTSVTHFTGLPSFPFAPMIYFWAEVESGYRFSQVDPKLWIRRISPRPVLVLQGGADRTVSSRSGELLYTAAAEPKELWYEPLTDHARFVTNMPAYEQRVVGFFDKHLSPNRVPTELRGVAP